MQHDEVEMEVFRTGDYGAKGTYSEADLQQMAADYRPDLLEAPLTFDHAQAGPAYGWVSRLRCDGDRLIVALKGVPQAVRDLVSGGAYKRRSVELFRKLPHTGRPYLRAVSLLGAATPEVKGLRDICFAAANDECHVELLPAPETARSTATDAVSTAATAAPCAGADLRTQLLDSHVSLLFSELRADGYCLADRDAQAIRAIITGPRSEAAVEEFGEGDTSAHHGAATLDWLSGFLRQTLLRAPLGVAGDSGLQQFSHMSVQPDSRTGAGSAALHGAALQIQAQSPGMAYRDALCQASRRS